MNIKLNGKDKILNKDNMTISILLSDINVNLKSVIIELNGNIIEKTKFENTLLKNGDIIEILQFMAGG